MHVCRNVWACLCVCVCVCVCVFVCAFVFVPVGLFVFVWVHVTHVCLIWNVWRTYCHSSRDLFFIGHDYKYKWQCAKCKWSAAEFPNRLAILILLKNIPIFRMQKFDFFSSAKGVPFLPWKITLKSSPPSPFGVVPSLNALQPDGGFMLLYGKPDLSGAFTFKYML